MTDLSTCSTPNETLHKVTVYIYIKLYTNSSFCFRVIPGGVNLKFYPGKSEKAVYHFQLLIQCDTGGGKS